MISATKTVADTDLSAESRKRNTPKAEYMTRDR